MECPACKKKQCKVIYTNDIYLCDLNMKRRWRKCRECGKVYATVEFPLSNDIETGNLIESIGALRERYAVLKKRKRKCK